VTSVCRGSNILSVCIQQCGLAKKHLAMRFGWKILSHRWQGMHTKSCFQQGIGIINSILQQGTLCALARNRWMCSSRNNCPQEQHLMPEKFHLQSFLVSEAILKPVCPPESPCCPVVGVVGGSSSTQNQLLGELDSIYTGLGTGRPEQCGQSSPHAS
jgi:hypothetical protein